MKIRFRLLLFLLFIFISCRNSDHAFRQAVNEMKAQAGSDTLVFLSDTQSPLLPEKIFIGSDNNDEVIRLVLHTVAEEKPGAVFHLGDMTGLGYDDDKWEEMEAFIKKLNSSDIPLFPTLGNHELMIFSSKGMKKFMKRFPDYVLTGYTKKIDDIAIIMLNSNFDEMEDEEILQQDNWYVNEIKALEADTNVKSVIVCCHHSPFTYSETVDPDEDVFEKFVPPFVSSNKCKLFISGHAHMFEHFKYRNKDFLVIGGGGGLLQDRRDSLEEPIEGLEEIYARQEHHYMTLIPTGDSLIINIKFLQGFKDFEKGYGFSIN